MATLAVKYRPKTFDDVSEQSSVRVIIENQIKNNEVMHAYLFKGGAGTGKTTSARIVAQMINDSKGQPIELDAASRNGIEDVREIIDNVRSKPLGQKYKIYIIDECHMLSQQAWNGMLKLLEEPPKHAVFIFCTTDAHKIPATIISRVQSFSFNRISQQGIVDRLNYILQAEFQEGSDDRVANGWDGTFEDYYGSEVEEVLTYIAKLANGGMRDAISMLDKCLSYNSQLTMDNVVELLSGGVTPYEMLNITNHLIAKDSSKSLRALNEFFMTGIDLLQFGKMYFEFLLNINKLIILNEPTMTNLPDLVVEQVQKDRKYAKDNITYLVEGIQGVLTGPKIDVKVLLEAWVIHVCR